MNIGIIVYSNTGHTLSVGEEIKSALLGQGNEVNLIKLAVTNDDPKSKEPVRLLSVPDISTYDTLILGAPVIGGQIAPAMRAYLAQLPPLRDKRVACFITQYFPWVWMGGTQSLHQITNSLDQKGASVFSSGIVQWSSKKRVEQTHQLVENMRKIS